MNSFIETIGKNQNKIYNWLLGYETSEELPLYSSVDIRDAGFKIAAIDTNLFPAGFNNLCPHGISDAVTNFANTIKKRSPGCRTILIIAEEHTRNTWYLENVRILKSIVERAGYTCYVATLFDLYPDIPGDVTRLDLVTATGENIQIYSMGKILHEIESGSLALDLIIMNNDLSTGIPDILLKTNIPIYPSLNAGWHSRLKSHHFHHMAALIKEFSDILGVDPWFFSCLDSSAGDIDINRTPDREKLADLCSSLLTRIQAKYDERDIREKPFCFLKADYGTYGMGVMSFDDPKAILELNRKGRNKLYKGKSSRIINRFLLQEGVPSRCNIDEHVCETCVYQIDNQFVGGFYRLHRNKTTRENLNSKGMTFKVMCPHSSAYGQCGVRTEPNIFDIYRILARIAGIAAHREMAYLETIQKASS